MFKYEKELNRYIYSRQHKFNQKEYFKYYIDKKLYDLFCYAIIYPNSYEVEFYTLNDDYKNIWSKMRIYSDYGKSALIDCGYDENYFCYTVSVFCPDLLSYLRSMHDYCCVCGERLWKEKAKNCNWNDDEINQGYMKYKKLCDEWFERHYGNPYKKSIF